MRYLQKPQPQLQPKLSASGTSAPTWIATKRRNETEIHLEQTPPTALGATGGVPNQPGDVRGLWIIRPDLTDRKVLFGCATFNVARTPILMADSGSTAKFALGPSLACRSERINARFVTPSPISSPPRSLAAAAPPHVAPAALQLQHGWHSGRLRLGTIKPGWS